MPETDENAEAADSTYNPEVESKGWTAQKGGLPPETETGSRVNQVFVPEQLPNPEVAKAAGITPQNIPSNVIVSTEDGTTDPLGPEPGEIERAVRRANNDVVVNVDGDEADFGGGVKEIGIKGDPEIDGASSTQAVPTVEPAAAGESVTSSSDLGEDGSRDGADDEDEDDVDQYSTGGGWYEIDGEKYHGKDAARAALK